MFNKLILIGPVVKAPKSYGKVVKFVVGGYREYKGEREETKTEVVCFSRLADTANSLRVGETVAISGRVETKWRESKTGGEWASTDVIVDELRVIGESPGAVPPSKTPPLPPAEDWESSVPF